MGLVQLFKSRNDLSRNIVWRLIKLEQEKILSKVYAVPVVVILKPIITVSSMRSSTNGSFWLRSRPYSSTACCASKRCQWAMTASKPPFSPQ